jgi:DNA (cytosine-5)-methyltransferase 1
MTPTDPWTVRSPYKAAPRAPERKLRALDLFCCSGGASMGLHRAGFEIVGVDIEPQPYYPFEFHKADALTYPLEGFDFIWASPPCQAHSKTRAIHGKNYPDLIPQTRSRLERTAATWAIENVPGAPLRNTITLCGTMFGLKVIRHRLFELNFPIIMVPQCGRHGPTNSHRGYSTGAEFVTVAGNNYRRVEGAAAMDIGWYMPRDRLSQAIPPAYSEFIGRAAIDHILAPRMEAAE